jgi:hypothetical protein
VRELQVLLSVLLEIEEWFFSKKECPSGECIFLKGKKG